VVIVMLLIGYIRLRGSDAGAYLAGV